MRAGGEAAKLGQRYEAIWTVHELMDVLSGEAISLYLEPLNDPEGIEFIKKVRSGHQEFHSVKRNAPAGSSWTQGPLLFPNRKGRSPLKDLIQKLDADEISEARFVSTSSADWLRELTEDIAGAAETISEFNERLERNKRAVLNFDKFIPFFKNREAAFKTLKRIRAVAYGQTELLNTVEQRISGLICRRGGAVADPEELRLLLADWLLTRLGLSTEARHAWEFLRGKGYEEQDWSNRGPAANTVRKRNDTFRANVEADLVGGAQIRRSEAARIVSMLLESGESKHVVLCGPAGYGKSCVLAQVAALFAEQEVPHLALRLSPDSRAETSRQLGQLMDLDVSPAIALAGIAQGRRSVLFLDQLDAISIVAGIASRSWNAVGELAREAQKYPEMRLLFACRTFDLDHDHRLRRLTQQRPPSERIELQPLDVNVVRDIIERHPTAQEPLGDSQLEILRVPLHLQLFLEGNAGAARLFRTPMDLFDAYWDRKQQRLRERLGRSVRWIEVIDRLVSMFNDLQSVDMSLPKNLLDEFAVDAEAMASEHVLVKENNRYRFFHDSFFDYAFARRFVTTGDSLVDLLTGNSQAESQHLFRRLPPRSGKRRERFARSFPYKNCCPGLAQWPARSTH